MHTWAPRLFSSEKRHCNLSNCLIWASTAVEGLGHGNETTKISETCTLKAAGRALRTTSLYSEPLMQTGQV